MRKKGGRLRGLVGKAWGIVRCRGKVGSEVGGVGALTEPVKWICYILVSDYIEIEAFWW